jgi:hypothetical protein
VPIHVHAFQSGSVLHYRFSGRLTADDLSAAAATEEPYFRAASQDNCLNIIADFTDLEMIPPDLFPGIQQMRLFSDERACRVVIVGANPYLRGLMISLGLLPPGRRFTFSGSYDEGLHVLGLNGNGYHHSGSESGKAT